MSHVLEVIHFLRALEIHPIVGVVIAALLAALLEQRMARRRTPDFSGAFGDTDGAPQARPPELRRRPRR